VVKRFIHGGFGVRVWLRPCGLPALRSVRVDGVYGRDEDPRQFERVRWTWSATQPQRKGKGRPKRATSCARVICHVFNCNLIVTVAPVHLRGGAPPSVASPHRYLLSEQPPPL
jgi:hypothetical protein